MPDKIFFQCSLPRTGSTLLQNLLSQNEQIYASANNGLISMLDAAKEQHITSPEYKAQDERLMDLAFSGFSEGAIEGYYDAITTKRYVIDKSKGNFADYDLINGYYPSPKIICMVRNILDIVASMERLYQKNKDKDHPQINQLKDKTLGERNITWATQFLQEVDLFRDIQSRGLDNKMLFVKYESFCANPKIEMERIYDYLKIPFFQHQFDNIQQAIKEDEEAYGYTDMLTIRPKVEVNTTLANNSIDELAHGWIEEHFDWYNKYFHYKK